MIMEISNFHVPPGDWRNLAEVNFWNIEEPQNWLDYDGPNPGEFSSLFMSSHREGRTEENCAFGDFNWRVARVEGSHITIELCADTEPGNHFLQVPEMASTAPGAGPAEHEPAVGQHDLYLLETIPFGVVNVTVPRNAKDPFAHAEELARRAFKTPAADHMELRDHKDHKNENIRSDLYVELHMFGYHGT